MKPDIHFVIPTFIALFFYFELYNLKTELLRDLTVRTRKQQVHFVNVVLVIIALQQS